MTFITRTDDRAGLDGFPEGFTPLGSDDLGDVLAADGNGRVWLLQHGTGDWQGRSRAFESVQDLERYVGLQSDLKIPGDESLAAMRERKKRIQAWVKELRRAPYARQAVRDVLAELSEQIAERRFWASKRGKSIAARQNLGEQCERALRAAEVPGSWMVRAHAEQANALIVMGPISPEWSEARLRELLQPVVGDDHELLFFAAPRAGS